MGKTLLLGLGLHDGIVHIQNTINLVTYKNTNRNKTWSCTYKNLSKAAQGIERVNLLTIRTAVLLTDNHHPQSFQAPCLYLVESYDVDHPGTKPCSSRRLLSHKLWVELGVAEVVVSHTLHRGLRDVLFVKVHQSLQEVVHLEEHLCRADNNTLLRRTHTVYRVLLDNTISKHVILKACLL